VLHVHGQLTARTMAESVATAHSQRVGPGRGRANLASTIYAPSAQADPRRTLAELPLPDLAAPATCLPCASLQTTAIPGQVDDVARFKQVRGLWSEVLRIVGTSDRTRTCTTSGGHIADDHPDHHPDP